MKGRLLLLALLPGFAGIAHAADEILVVSSLDFAFKDMTLEVTSGSGTSKFNSNLTTISPGITMAYGRFYTNVSFDKSIDSASTTQIDQDQPSMLTISRSDAVLTLGYRALNYLNIYAGWLSGEISPYISGQTIINSMTGETAFYTQEISYTEKGPFAGISLSHNFGDKGTVSVSVAYAKLSGEMTQDRYIGTGSAGNIPVPNTRHDTGTADVKGLSYNLSWSGLLNGSMGYRVGVKSTRYEGKLTTVGADDINEFYTAFYIGLTNTF